MTGCEIPKQDLNFLGRLAGTPSTINSPDTYQLFQYFLNTFIPPLIRPGAHQGYFNHYYMVSMGLQTPPLMDIYIACAALQLAHKHADLLPKALQYYSSAVIQTRRMIAEGELRGTEDWPIVMTIFLCLFERWQPGPSKEIIHLRGAAQLLALRGAKLNAQQLITPFNRLYAESVLYNTMVSTLLSDDIPSHDQVWSQISTYFTASPFPDTTWEANSPIIVVGPDLFRLILTISCFARCEKLTGDQLAQIHQIGEDLQTWLPAKEELKSQQFWDQDTGHQWATLYAISADILCFKMLHPSQNDTHGTVQRRVQQGLEILQRAGPGRFQSHIVCLPILVLGCATVAEADFKFLLANLDDTWQKSYLGDTRRAADVLKAVWARRIQSCDSLGFGSDVFVQKRYITYIRKRTSPPTFTSQQSNYEAQFSEM
ncbi:hypothetical protein BP5796_01698 [Coleophoma crateriformis]|uniref:Transcription factor domain-containing protein n=1 Tax=Coleophoma crateriformis TaxID=565419 RepID=A0A3D8T192_9HELO|nr:hypothetical protein BP5796_01698 [Coleophoma crateriformis]